MDAYAAINNMLEISWNIIYLLSNIYAGIGEIMGMGYHVNDMQTMQTNKLQLMMLQGSHTKQLHKLNAQIDHTRQDDVMAKNGNLKCCFWMLQSNSGAYGVPETGYLTEFHPS